MVGTRMFLDARVLLVSVVLVALTVTVAFLLRKERTHRQMWIVKSAVLSLVLILLGGTVAEAVGLGMIAGLLWEILNEISSHRPNQ